MQLRLIFSHLLFIVFTCFSLTEDHHILQIRQALAWEQLVNPRNLELIRGNYVRNEQHHSEQQIPSSQQPVHLMMAG
jgi:hypothetical protein